MKRHASVRPATLSTERQPIEPRAAGSETAARHAPATCFFYWQPPEECHSQGYNVIELGTTAFVVQATAGDHGGKRVGRAICLRSVALAFQWRLLPLAVTRRTSPPHDATNRAQRTVRAGHRSWRPALRA